METRVCPSLLRASCKRARNLLRSRPLAMCAHRARCCLLLRFLSRLEPRGKSVCPANPTKAKQTYLNMARCWCTVKTYLIGNAKIRPRKWGPGAGYKDTPRVNPSCTAQTGNAVECTYPDALPESDGGQGEGTRSRSLHPTEIGRASSFVTRTENSRHQSHRAAP